MLGNSFENDIRFNSQKQSWKQQIKSVSQKKETLAILESIWNMKYKSLFFSDRQIDNEF